MTLYKDKKKRLSIVDSPKQQQTRNGTVEYNQAVRWIVSFRFAVSFRSGSDLRVLGSRGHASLNSKLR